MDLTVLECVYWSVVIGVILGWLVWIIREDRQDKRKMDQLYADAREADRRFYNALGNYLSDKGNDHE
jgi:hypothetical protein